MKKKRTRRKLTQEQVDSINRKFDLLEGTELDFENPKERIIIGPDGRGTTVSSWSPEYPHYPDPVTYSEEGKRDLRRAVKAQWPQIVKAVAKLEGATIKDGHIVVDDASVVERHTQDTQNVPPTRHEGSTPSAGTKLVVHCKKHPFDVYVGRPSPYGNPFSHQPKSRGEVKVDSREDAIACFREWVMGQPEMIKKIKQELRGKVLGCWCSPKACHADVLAEIANS